MSLSAITRETDRLGKKVGRANKGESGKNRGGKEKRGDNREGVTLLERERERGGEGGWGD